jgi:hypothetical protein
VSIARKQVRARRGRTVRMQRGAFGLHPSWRFRHTLNQQKVTNGGRPPQKSIKNEGRSGNVYENKGSNDKLTETTSGICAQLNPILKKIKAWEGQFTVNYAFRMVFWSSFPRLVTFHLQMGIGLRRTLNCPPKASRGVGWMYNRCLPREPRGNPDSGF